MIEDDDEGETTDASSDTGAHAPIKQETRAKNQRELSHGIFLIPALMWFSQSY